MLVAVAALGGHVLVTAGAVTRPACLILGLRLMPPALTQKACGLSGERWRSVASSQNSQIGCHKRLQQTKLVGTNGPICSFSGLRG